jgi:predicted dehydrogenase
VTLVGVCDLDIERAAATARRLPAARVYSSADELISNEDLDILDIATPVESHRGLIEIAAANGIHVLCQKPMAPNMSDAFALVDLCRSAGVKFMVLEMARFLPWIAAMMEYSHHLGKVYQYRHFGERDSERVGRLLIGQPYLRSQSQLIIRERVIHSIDAARVFLGDVETIYARATTVDPIFAGEDTAVLLLGHNDSATSTHDFTWAASSHGKSWHGGEITVEGTQGGLRLSFDTMELRCSAKGISVNRSFDWASGFQLAFSGAVASFANSVRNNTGLEYEASDNLNTLAATYAAYESISTRCVIRL